MQGHLWQPHMFHLPSSLLLSLHFDNTGCIAPGQQPASSDGTSPETCSIYQGCRASCHSKESSPVLQQLTSLLDVTDSCYFSWEEIWFTEAVRVHRTRTEQETYPFIVDNDSLLTGCFVGAEVLLDAPVTSPETAHTLLAPGTMTKKAAAKTGQPRKGQPPSLKLQKRKSRCSRCRFPQQGHCSTVIEREVHRSNEDVMETHYKLYGDMIWKWK